MKMSMLEKFLVNNRLFDFWRVRSMQYLLKHVRPTTGRVLELGCGKGTTTLQIAKRLPSSNSIATDFDPEQVRLAKTVVKNVLIADASHLKFEDCYFSAVFAFLTFHHVENWKRAVREAFRVLKRGGDLYLDELALKPFPRLKHFFFSAPGVFSKQEFFNELENVGFYESAALVMQLIGYMDVAVALSALFFPLNLILIWATIWAFATALIRPITGEPVWDFVERTSNWAAPLALLFLRKFTSKK